MSTTPTGGAPTPATPSSMPHAPDAPNAARGPAISEDWLATIAGLVLLGLVLAGVITKAMVP